MPHGAPHDALATALLHASQVVSPHCPLRLLAVLAGFMQFEQDETSECAHIAEQNETSESARVDLEAGAEVAFFGSPVPSLGHLRIVLAPIARWTACVCV